MTKGLHRVAMLGGAVLCTAAFSFGGWAVVTVDDVPDYLVTGKPVPLSFVVRQHGATLLSGLSPSVTIQSGSTQTSVAARATGGSGHYAASVTVPRAGDWTITVNSGFGPSKTTLMPLKAIDAGAAAPPALSDADRGLRLFVAKSCTTCHVRGLLGTDGMKVGPELTGRRYVADYVAKFLADPERSPLAGPNTGQTRMPNFNLREREIAALVSYLNSDLMVSSRNSSP